MELFSLPLLRMKLQKLTTYIRAFTLAILLVSCSKSSDSTNPIPQEVVKEITIFHINDSHGSIENFAKIRHIIDAEKAESNVIMVAAGDMFSGNPVVDNHDEKGYPMIDLMNKIDTDVAVLGNHEFDYGENVLNARMHQANFNWVCANVSMGNTGVMQPLEYATVVKDDVKVTFLGLVETNGKKDTYIPSTHPWRVQNFSFLPYQDVIVNYDYIKEETDADVYVALTHLGESTDISLANNYPYFDLIIGGHSHTKTNTTVNGIPIMHAGSYLNYMGKIEIEIVDDEIDITSFELIDLNNYPNSDATLDALIANYNESTDLDEVIGYADAYHSKSNLGAFYTHALKTEMEADISFQNPGGVRNDLDEGPITKREIYAIDPFNNGSVTYSMSVGDIKTFLIETRSAIYFSGIKIEQDGQTIDIRNEEGLLLNDDVILKLAINDYIPAVHDAYFSSPTFWPLTTAEVLINYLEQSDGNLDFSGTNRYFRFDAN